MKMMITGGAGFIGSHAIRFFLSSYPDVRIVNLDKLTYAGNRENLTDVEARYGDRYSFMRGDIASSDDVSEAADGAEVIINFAAETHVDRSILDSEAFLRTDIFGTYTLLEYIRTHPVKKFIQISTDEVFGAADDDEFTEHSPFQPNSPYAASKAGADLLCRAYVTTYGAPVIVTHSCNVYGPNQYPEKFIPLCITNLFENSRVPVYGDGTQIREWIYTDDYCRALETVYRKGKLGEVYNIGTQERKKNIDVVRGLLRALGKNEDCIEHVKDRPGHDVKYAVNSDKLKALGWVPTVPFAVGLSKTIDWYRNNTAWWQNIKSGEYMKYYRQQYAQR